MRVKNLKLVILVFAAIIFGVIAFSENRVGAFQNGPDPGFTGAPGESTCTACHGGGPAGGVLTIEGLPTSYTAGQQITVTVRLNHPGRPRYGFELTALGPGGTSAGTIELIEPTRTQLKQSFFGPQRTYVEHTFTGTAPFNAQGLWTFRWTAPATSTGTVTFYAAGNSANGDSTSSGDAILTTNAAITAQSTPPPPTFTVVSAGSFLQNVPLSANSVAAGFSNLAFQGFQSAPSVPLPVEMLGVRVLVTDSANVERASSLFFVSGGPSGQINFLIPDGTANGAATTKVTLNGQTIAQGTLNIVSVRPALFAANSSGAGYASAQIFRLKGDGSFGFEDTVRFDQTVQDFVPIPIDLGPDTDQVFLVLYGTAFRNRSSVAACTALLGGLASQVVDALAHPVFIGVDQANVRISRTLAGRGDVNVEFTVDGQTANTLKVNIK